MLFNAIYEVRLNGRDVKISRDVWDDIREHARGNKWFYVVHMNRKYKYVKPQEFFDRPTRFDFEEVDFNYEETIDIIYI